MQRCLRQEHEVSRRGQKCRSQERLSDRDLCPALGDLRSFGYTSRAQAVAAGQSFDQSGQKGSSPVREERRRQDCYLRASRIATGNRNTVEELRSWIFGREGKWSVMGVKACTPCGQRDTNSGMDGIHGEGADGISYFLWIIDCDDKNRLETCFRPGLGRSRDSLNRISRISSNWDGPLRGGGRPAEGFVVFTVVGAGVRRAVWLLR